MPPDLPRGLETPCAIVDLNTIDANLATMAEAQRQRGVALRPHVKSHSSSAIAHRQIGVGARGLTAGTLGMAEALVQSGVDDVFVANSIWPTGTRALRLHALHDAGTLSVGFDSHEGALALSAAVAGARQRLRVLVEIDSGEHRAGVKPGDAGILATAAMAAGLDVVGAFTHGGHAYDRPGAAAGAADDEVTALETAGASLRDAGIEPSRLSAGSTPTALRSARPPVNEQRPGTYALGDRQQLALGGSRPDQIALFIAATVASTAVQGQVVLDSGAKTLGKDRPEWLDGHGSLPAYPTARVAAVSDYHTVVVIPPGTPTPALGEVVAVVPNHACTAVNLTDCLLAVRGGRIVARWPVDLRSRS